MMRYVIGLLIVGIMLMGLPLHVTPTESAPNRAEIALGDRVYIAVDELHVYSRPDAGSNWVEILPQGMISQVIATETDANGLVWYYLRDNAFGWVPGVLSGIDLIIPYESQDDLWALVDQATTRITADPTDVQAYFWRGILYHSLNQNEDAITDLTRALELDAQNDFIYDFRAKVYLRLDLNESAVADGQAAINLGRNLPNTYNRIGIAYSNMDNYQQGIEYYDQALALAPDYGLLYSNKAIPSDRLYGPNAALDLYTQAIEIDPLLSVAYTNRARTYRDMGHHTEALADYTQAIEIDPYSSDAYYARGNYYVNNTNDENAGFDDFSMAVVLDPTNGAALAERGIGYLYRGEYEKAVDDLERALELEPDTNHIQYNLAAAYSRTGRYTAALEQYNAVINRGGQYSFSAHLYRAQLYVHRGDLDSALADAIHYTNNMGTTPNMGYFNIFAYMLLGSIHAHRGEYVAAQHAYTDALAVDPATARIFISWASGWQVVPDRDKVLFKQSNALAADPTNPDLILRVANLYLELGYWSDAIAQYHAYLNVVDTPPTGLSDFTAWLEQNLE